MGGSNDARTRKGIAGAVLLVAAIAAIVSYIHIQNLAVTHGQTELAATLLPFSIDGTVVASSLVLLRAAWLGVRPPWLAQVMLLSSVLATLAANVAYGAAAGMTGALLSGWPAYAFIGCTEMAILMARRTRQPEAAAEPVQEPAPVTAAVTVPKAREIQARQKCSPATAQKIRSEVRLAVRASQNGHGDAGSHG